MSVGRIENYTDLKDVIADYLDRGDLASQIPGFIQLCEANIGRKMRELDTVCRGKSIGWRQDVFIPLPDDWLEGINMRIVLAEENPDVPGEYIDGESYQMTYQPPDAINQMNEENIQWRPTEDWNFTYHGRTVEIYPDPEQQFRLELDYYKRPVPLSDSAPTNDTLEKHPDLYLYGSLVHSAPFLRDDSRLGIWSTLAGDALDGINTAGEKAMTSGSRLTRKVNYSMG